VRSTAKNVADAHAAPPAAAPATATPVDQPNLTDAVSVPSQPLALKVLQRQVESTQYTSWLFGSRLRAAGLLGSMGKVAYAYDNFRRRVVLRLVAD
jgi:hypothetical protein